MHPRPEPDSTNPRPGTQGLEANDRSGPTHPPFGSQRAPTVDRGGLGEEVVSLLIPLDEAADRAALHVVHSRPHCGHVRERILSIPSLSAGRPRSRVGRSPDMSKNRMLRRDAACDPDPQDDS